MQLPIGDLAKSDLSIHLRRKFEVLILVVKCRNDVNKHESFSLQFVKCRKTGFISTSSRLEYHKYRRGPDILLT